MNRGKNGMSEAVVSWSETDASGRFHFTAPFRWAEDAEHALYRRTTPSLDPASFPRRTASATYHRPLRAGDRYTVKLDVECIGRTSITYRWHILSADIVCAEGSHTVVHIDSSGRPAAVPESLRSTLASEDGTRRMEFRPDQGG